MLRKHGRLNNGVVGATLVLEKKIELKLHKWSKTVDVFTRATIGTPGNKYISSIFLSSSLPFGLSRSLLTCPPT